MTAAKRETTFDVGSIHAVVCPARDGALARFMLFRVTPSAEPPKLLVSGTDHDFASCLARAQRAAQALDGRP